MSTTGETIMNALRMFAGALIAAGACTAAPAAEPPFPSRPIRVVVPFAPGGATDILVRSVGQKLNELLGQPAVVDNRGGAGGAIGAEIVARSAPDGYTIMATTSGVIVVNPSLYRKLGYNPAVDFAPVTIVASLSNLLVVSPSSPAKSVKELVALARAKPGTLTYASGGNGTSNHLAGELLKYLAGVNLVHVPYKGGGPAVLATMSGEVSMLFATLPSALAQAKSGKLRALAVTSRKRNDSLPEVPTMIEAGVKDFELVVWVGVLAPRGTPAGHIARLNGDIGRALQAPEVAARLRAEGYDPVGSTPAEMAAAIKTETAMWARVLKAAGIQAD